MDGKLLCQVGVNVLRGQALVMGLVPDVDMGCTACVDDVLMAWARMKFKNWSRRGVDVVTFEGRGAGSIKVR